MKSYFKTLPIINPVWANFRCKQLLGQYRARREMYSKILYERNLKYSELNTISEIQDRIIKRGYRPIKKKSGQVHTFAIIPQFSWHKCLLPDLFEIGPVTLFDYVGMGYSPQDFYGNSRWGNDLIMKREKMVSKVMPIFEAAHEKNPVDWILCYGGGQDISAGVIRAIVDKYGIPVVNMTFDDKQGWAGPHCGEHQTGAKDITKEFDAFFTSARISCDWHLAEGGRAIYMPEGFDSSSFYPRNIERDLAVSFVGVSYGFRKSVVNFLQDHNVNIHPYGSGWKNGFVEDSVEIFNRSTINLGMGGIGYSESLTNVKGRDFEIPGTGGGVYLTAFNPDLSQHFNVGSEILCYRNRDEMLELIRYYLQNPQEAKDISVRARDRSLREHRWIHRYQKMLGIIGIL